PALLRVPHSFPTRRSSDLRPLAIPLELRGVSLRLNVPEKIRITGDRLWLSEALQNILKNCMESAGHGGRIAIACRDTPLFTEITDRKSTRLNSSHVSISYA